MKITQQATPFCSVVNTVDIIVIQFNEHTEALCFLMCEEESRKKWLLFKKKIKSVRNSSMLVIDVNWKGEQIYVWAKWLLKLWARSKLTIDI